MPNPRGRPRGHKPLIDVIGQRRRVALIEKQYELAMAGDSTAAKALLDRMDPTLARQNVELSGAAGKPIALEHAEIAAAELNTDILRELDQIAERMNVERGNGAANGRGNVEH